MEIEAAVIHIGGAHNRHLIVRYEHLGVDKSGGVLIDFDAAPDQLGIIGTGHHMDIPFIRHMGCDDAHIDSALGGVDERSDHLIVQDQIGRRDIDIVMGPVDDLHIGSFRHIEVVQGAVAEGLHKAIAGQVHGGTVPVKVRLHCGGELPHHQEHQREVPHRLSPEHHSGILPVSVLLIGVDVLVRQIESAAVADIAVNDGDLPVIPIVHRHIQMGAEGVEDSCADARLFQGGTVVGGQGLEGAHIIVEQPDFHTGSRLLLENLQDGVPHLALPNDEILHEDKLLRLLELLFQRFKERLTNGEILTLGAVPYREAGYIFNIGRFGGKIPVHLGEILPAAEIGVDPLDGGVIELLDAGFQIVRGALVAEHQIEQPAEYRHS